MTREERITLQAEYVERLRNGEQELLPKLWELMQPLVNKYTQKYLAYSKGGALFDIDDLTQEAYFALIRALDIYRPSAGASFSRAFMWAFQNQTRRLRGLVGNDTAYICTSLDIPIGEDGDSTIGDMIIDPAASESFDTVEKSFCISCLRKSFEDINAQLSDEERYIVRSVYYDQMEINAIAERQGLTVSQCFSLLQKAIRVYRQPKNRRLLYGYICR